MEGSESNPQQHAGLIGAQTASERSFSSNTLESTKIRLNGSVNPSNGPCAPQPNSTQSSRSTPKPSADTLQPILSSSLLPKCYGKISNLENYVPKEWWTTLFADSLYLKTDGDCVEDPLITQNEVKQLLDDQRIKTLLDSASPPNIVNVLDLCCGQGRHSVYLAQRYPNVRFHGHDQSEYLINLARSRSALASPIQPASTPFITNTTFTVGDCQTIPYPASTFNLILLLGNSFGYFPSDSGDIQSLTEIARVAHPEALLAIDLTDGNYMRESFSPRSWEWLDNTTFACRERELSKDGLRLVSREVVCEVGRGVIRDQFYQERLYGREEVEKLMFGAGFDCKDVGLKEEIVVVAKELSKRKEDLGMMEQRMLVKGIKRSDKGLDSLVNGITLNGTLHKPLSFPQLTIILGDASKPCLGKLNDTWNEEDLATRTNLITALYTLGYTPDTLSIISTHTELIQLLQKNTRPVFNLCDEGYNNNATQEGHVPALLEMLGVEYTGAGPTCLAVCYDKGLVSRSAHALGIAIPTEVFICDITNITAKRALELQRQIVYPAFIKPMKGDNSLGITMRSIVKCWSEVEAYFEELTGLGISDVICQEGAEYSIGMIGNTAAGFTYLPVLEVDYSKLHDSGLPPILGFESKWQPDSPYWTDISYKPASLSPALLDKLQRDCAVMWDRFGCRDYARFDFRSDGEGEVKLLEANPNPGWCWDGKFAKMAAMGGVGYAELLGMVLDAAHLRITRE